MGCCATGRCRNPVCPVCVGVPARFQPVVRCPTVLEVGKHSVQCRYRIGHPRACAPGSRKRGEDPSSEHWWRDDPPGDGGDR